VLGAVDPVAAVTEAAGGTGTGTVNGKDKDSLEWSEVGTECQKRVYICTNRREDWGIGMGERDQGRGWVLWCKTLLGC